MRAAAASKSAWLGMAASMADDVAHFFNLASAALRICVSVILARQRLRIGFQLDEGGLAGIERADQRRAELPGLLDRLAVRAVAAGECREIRIDEARRHDAPRVLALLMHADGAIHAVVDDE